MTSFSVEAMVRGYHVYRDVWAASIGELLPCEREEGNASDRYAVAMASFTDSLQLWTVAGLIHSERDPWGSGRLKLQLDEGPGRK